MQKFNLEYIFENYIRHRTCKMCHATWIKFSHKVPPADTFGIYRLGRVTPEDCHICKPVDEQLSKKKIYSVEKWIKGDDL
tara:strand:+ start:1122 stop:1361 length:240 start_codon:yes stop_codon:yes gene_type:complete